MGAGGAGHGALLVPPQGGPGLVSPGAGVWSQGAEEGRHPGQGLHDRHG